MSLITRAKNILLSPGSEWLVIEGETDTPQSLLGKYVIPMSLIPAVAMFIGFGIIGYSAFMMHVADVKWGLTMGLISFITSILGYFISTFVIDALAPSFGSQKNIGKTAQLVAYSYTASWVAGILYLLPSLLTVAQLLGLYGIYLFYMGLPVMKKTPEDKRAIYMIVSAIVIIVVWWLLRIVVNDIVYSIMGNPFLPDGGVLDSKWR